jgi:hypothetical protein
LVSIVRYNAALLKREKTRRLNGGDSTAIVGYDADLKGQMFFSRGTAWGNR